MLTALYQQHKTVSDETTQDFHWGLVESINDGLGLNLGIDEGSLEIFGSKIMDNFLKSFNMAVLQGIGGALPV